MPSKSSSRVLVVDDEQLIRWSLGQELQRRAHNVLEAATAAEARSQFTSGVDAVLLDQRLPDGDGLQLLPWMQSIEPDVPIIMLTAHSTVNSAVSAMRSGAFDYTCKPFDVAEVALTVERALEATRARRELRALRTDSGAPGLECILGHSEAMQKIKGLVQRIATSPGSTVLITGESGTGKNLVARAIHDLSDRAGHDFMTITCSALPPTLLESELFGHERGAFTGANTRKEGLLERAHRGTVFLDEIGEMDPALQAKLLRVLEEKQFRRVGGTRDISTDVRIIAATNANLHVAVQKNLFRRDLYYRLAVLTIHLPRLCERGDDVVVIAGHLIDRFAGQFGKTMRGLSPAARNALTDHSWPGNVRELRNAVERAVLLCDGDTLDITDFAFLSDTAVEEIGVRLPASGVDIREVEKSLTIQALERTGGNQTRAGKLLGMTRDQIRYRIQRYGLSM